MPETTPERQFTPLNLEERQGIMQRALHPTCWADMMDEAAAVHHLGRYEATCAHLEAQLAQVRAQQGAVRLDVSEIRQGEENDGPLMSTDLFVEGRGFSLLCNVSAGESFTYYAKVDGQELGGGTVGTSSLSGEALATGTPPAPDGELSKSVPKV